MILWYFIKKVTQILSQIDCFAQSLYRNSIIHFDLSSGWFLEKKYFRLDVVVIIITCHPFKKIYTANAVSRFVILYRKWILWQYNIIRFFSAISSQALFILTITILSFFSSIQTFSSSLFGCPRCPNLIHLRTWYVSNVEVLLQSLTAPLRTNEHTFLNI